MISQPLRSLYDLTLPEVEVWVDSQGQPSYRAKQIFQALYQKGQEDPASWTVLPKPLREQFAQEFPGPALALVQKKESHDGTCKWLSKLPDGQLLETVLIPAPASGSSTGTPLGRRTVCASTQVGCAFRCAFCASGLNGFRRNLTAGEIVQQVALVNKWLDAERHTASASFGPRRLITHVVFMGMGEPLANYDNLLKAIRILNAAEGLHIGARKITISTVGLVPMIARLSKEGLQVELSVSLHAPNDELRGKIMPVNRKYPVKQLIGSCHAYVRATKRLITFEYILIDQVNDGPEQAKELAVLLRGLLAKVNLIPCHPIPGMPFGRPAMERMLAFERILREQKITCTLRRSRGLDIEGACGQLRLHQIDPGGHPRESEDRFPLPRE